MVDIIFTDRCTVTVVRQLGGDQDIADDARVSTGVINSWSPGQTVADQINEQRKNAGLIRALMRERHGTPFEAPQLHVEIEAPIFVARESHRHRMISLSEVSGRYVELAPIFWVPPADRPLVQVGKAMAYQLEPGNFEQIDKARRNIESISECAWHDYQEMLGAGVAREVARVVLPVNIMTRWRARANLRAWLTYLSLRTRDDRATYESKPMLEIQEVALQIEEIIAQQCPAAYAAFCEFGRVAP